MKKVTMIVGIAILMISCGEDQQAKVCECKKLYDEILLKADQAEEAGGNWTEARKEAEKATNGKFEECDAFHTKEVGDKEFYEMGKNCK